MAKEGLQNIPARKVKTIEIVTKMPPGTRDQLRAETRLERREVVVIRHIIPAGEEGFVYLTYGDGDEEEIKLARELTVVDYSVDVEGFSELKIKYYPDKEEPVKPPEGDDPPRNGRS
jgi:hypothetical protein